MESTAKPNKAMNDQGSHRDSPTIAFDEISHEDIFIFEELTPGKLFISDIIY